MRLTIIIMTTLLLQVSAATRAQKVTLNLKNASLVTVLQSVKQQTGYNFLYPIELRSKTKPVSIKVKDMELQGVLEACFADQPFVYSLEEKTVVVKEKEKSVLEKIVDRFQAIDVRGKVVDATSGEGLPGANVKVKGLDRVASTDKDGNFSLQDVNDDAILEISYIGYVTKTVRAGKDVGTIRLEMATSDLQEVTINKGYYTEKKAMSTGSVGSVTAKVIEQQPVNNPLLALQGRVSGLFIEQSSGISGSKMNVSLRGKSSIQNGTDPLYVIDGVPFTSQTLGGSPNSSSLYSGQSVNTIYSINSPDIESIEILKDADATAIYGSRGANGVVLITTKQGKQGKAKLNLNISNGASKVPYFLDLMNSEEYLQMRHQAFRNDNRAIGSFHYDVNGVWDTTRNVNWQKELIGGTAQYTNAQASVSGGSQSTKYLLSAALQKQTGVYIVKQNERKGSILFSVSNESPNEKFKSRFSTNYVINSNNFNGGDLTANALKLAPVSPKLYNDDGTLNWENSTYSPNPIAYQTNGRFNFKSYNLISNASLGYEILPRLELKANFGLNDLRRDEAQLSPHTINDPAFGQTPAASRVYTTNGRNTTWIAEPQLSWSNNGDEIGKISILIGSSFQNQERSTQSFLFQGFATNSFMDDPGSASSVFSEGSSKSVYKYSALFARVNYSLKDKYIINLTGRRDGSSRFGPGKQFANLGAIGGAWIFSKEGFAQNIKFLSFGKLRGSYGLTGNDQIGDYRYLDTYEPGGNYDGVSTLIPTKLFNSNYAWETTKKFEVALEMSFLKDRINLTAAYYNNRSSNQLIEYRVSSITGFRSVLKNFPAKIENSGIEFDLSTQNTFGKFKWSTSANLSMPRNKLVEFEGLESSSYAQTYVVGKSLTINKVFNYLRVDPSTGVYTFEDMNGDGSISDADRMAYKELNTKFFGGINNSFSYKGFAVDIFFQFVNKRAQSLFRAFNPPGATGNQPKSLGDNTWTSKNTGAEFQRLTTNNSNYQTAYDRYIRSTAGIVDASFIRLKNVSLSYKIPTKWIAGVESTLFIQGQNLFTLSSYDGLDPETGPGFTLPTLRTIVIGANISL